MEDNYLTTTLLFQNALKERLNLSREEYFFLIVIIVTASLLRFWDLGAVGFNGDEAVYGGQSATLAAHEEFAKFFSIYRAHPLFLQFTVSLLFANFGVSDIIARIAPAIFGVLTAILVYFIGKELYSKNIAMLAAVLIAILPYHIIVSRQVLLDVPLSFFSTLTIYIVIRFVKENKSSLWLYLIGISSGLAFLSKEVGIFVLISSIISLVLTKKLSTRNLIVIIISFLLATSPYWIPILTIKEAQQTAFFYWQWQTTRDQNQPYTFYLSVIFKYALGYVLTGLFVLSLIYLWKAKNIKNPETLVLLSWVGVTIVLFQLLPIKGFHFGVSLIPPILLLAASIFESVKRKRKKIYKFLPLIVIPLVILTTGSSLNYLFQIISPPLAGSGGIPYVRESALWMKYNIQDNDIVLTLDATTANIIKFYANKEVFSLHSNRNPAYTEIGNPDLYIITGQIRYLVLQPNVTENYPHLREEADQLDDLVVKYGGVPIHLENQTYSGKNGEIFTRPAVIIYSLEETKGG